MSGGRLSRVAVVGATGFVGRALVAGLQRAGTEVVPVRAPRLSAEEPEARSARVADVQEHVDALARRLRGCAAVVNCAGIADSASRPSPQLLGANALLPVVIAAAAQAAGARQTVHVSSSAVCGRTPHGALPASPLTPYGESKALGELALAHWVSSGSGGRHSVLVYRAGSVMEHRGRLRRGRHQRVRVPVPVAVPAGQSPFVFLNDLVEELTRLALEEPAGSRILLGRRRGVDTLTALHDLVPAAVAVPVPRPVLAAALRLIPARSPRLVARQRQLEVLMLGHPRADVAEAPLEDLLP